MPFSSYAANEILSGNALSHATMWVQVHIGDPGAAGTLEVSTASPTRASAAFSAVANVLDNDSDYALPADGTGTNTVTHVTLWDAVTGGNFLYDGDIVPPITFLAGDAITIPAGDLVLTLVKAT